MGEPSSWREMTLGEICAEGGGGVQTGPFGSQLHARDYVESGIPSVMPQNIGDNVIVEEGVARIAPADAKRLSKYLLREGDIVYARRGDVEKRALVHQENDGWLCGTGCLRVRLGADSLHDSRFVSYQLGTEEARSWIRRHAVGATMPNLNTSILSAVPLRMPDPAMQRAIAEVLGAFDDKIAANLGIAQAADALASTLFTDQVRRHAILSEWTFDDVADIRGGGTPSSKVAEYWDGDVMWATPTDVTGLEGPYLFDTARKITDAGLASCSSGLYPAGSILMTSRATIGAFAIAQQPTAVNQGFIVVVPRDEIPPMWLFHEMRSRVTEFTSMANGATFLELSRGNFKKFRVRLPDASTMARFEERASGLHKRAAAALKENTALTATRDALLPALMSGKLRVRDAERAAESSA